ncbi:DUF4926 domain-containing protein [Aphanothece sacrum]|uniref:DUF4926 domain-containing protein n=1 Tax=Aphanothece sacrum FPU1 TaxID=1920663 RepID=A0A401IGM3_APHSA|nr:DUF4926 domain-containing protein [Aphanothece sacrum]GBF80369.1 hypothetical protein AsFPU1_1770 [Aphanothece sacrum FPU1]GBF84924.1 hypothetical protein AsFPU3_1979 [Aphanothece sacrum FPU3]
MQLPLFSEVRLTTDLPNYNLNKGCSAIIVEHFQNKEEKGYLLEVLDENNQGYRIIAVTPNQIELINSYHKTKETAIYLGQI